MNDAKVEIQLNSWKHNFIPLRPEYNESVWSNTASEGQLILKTSAQSRQKRNFVQYIVVGDYSISEISLLYS